MKHGEATVLAGKTAMASARAGVIAGILLVVGLSPLALDAAIEGDKPASATPSIVIDSQFPRVVAVDNDDTLPPAVDQARAPTKVAEADAPPSEAAEDEHTKELDAVFPPKELGLMDRVQDWLARANREFQFTIIRRLSTAPPGGGGDDIARKLEDVKEEDAEAAADRAEEAIQAAQAKQAAEAKRRQELAEAQEKAKAQQPPPLAKPQVVPKPEDSAALAEEMRKERERLEAESKRIEEKRKLAEDKRKTDEQKRLEDLRLAAQAKLAEQKAAVEKKAAEDAAAKETAAKAAQEKELAAQQAAEAQHQRDLADAAEKASEQAKRVAEEEAAKAAAAKEAEERRKAEVEAAAQAKQQAEAQEAARKAAEKEALEKAKEVAAKEAAAAAEKQKAEQAAEEAKKKDHQKQAMVETEDKDKTNVAEAPAAAEPPHEEASPAKSEANSSEDTDEVSSRPKVRRARLHRVASLARGPVVKPWARRARQGRCHYAGRKILLPGRYTVAQGDTLSLISLKHYRTSRYYLRIYRANRDIIRYPNLIYPCQRLYLPRRPG